MFTESPFQILSFPIRMRVECCVIPKGCRKIRSNYYIEETREFKVRRLLGPIPIALEVRESSLNKKIIPYYFWRGKLWKKQNQTLAELLTYLAPKEEPHWNAPHPITDQDQIISTKLDESIQRIQGYLQHALVTEDNTLLEEAPEPGYSISHHLWGDAYNVDTHPTWGSNFSYRADQWDLVWPQVKKEYRTKNPPIKILIPEALKAKKNIGDLELDPEGETATVVFEKIKSFMEFHREFQPQDDHERLQFFPPTDLEGKWTAALLNRNSEEILVVLLEHGKQNGKIQTIVHYEVRYTFRPNWREAVNMLRRLIETGHHKRTDFEWQVFEMENTQAKSQQEEEDLSWSNPTVVQTITAEEEVAA